MFRSFVAGLPDHGDQAAVIVPDAEQRGIGLGFFPRRRVHQARARLIAHRRQHGLPLVLGTVKGAYCQVDFGPVEVADDLAGIVQAQPFGNLPAHRRRGGRGQRGHRGPRRERLDDRAQPQVVGTEIVAPGGDAVRLVHRDQPHRRPGQAVPHVVARQLLRSQEDEARPAAAEQRIGLLAGGPAGQPVDRHRAQAARPQRVRLLPLQRQQRGHHDHRAAQGDRRDLVDRRLPGAAGQHDQAVAAGGQRGRGLHLRRPAGRRRAGTSRAVGRRGPVPRSPRRRPLPACGHQPALTGPRPPPPASLV